MTNPGARAYSMAADPVKSRVASSITASDTPCFFSASINRAVDINAHQQSIPDHSAQVAEIEKIFQQQYKKLKKHYNYPRKLLEQSGFVSADGKHPARLNISMLANTKAFVSPLMHLLNELRTDGHDVSAPWDEAIAMRDAIIAANNTLEEIYMTAIEATVKPASTAGNKNGLGNISVTTYI